MLYYDRIDVSEGTDVIETVQIKRQRYFSLLVVLDKGFKFQLDVCNGCHDFLMMYMDLSDIAILNTKGADYCCIISRISKSEAINLMQNIDLTKKAEKYKT